LGKTKGVLAPHEFWYFWRRFFHFGDIQVLGEDSLAIIQADRFVAELAALESVFDKPLAMKGMIVNWNIHFINQILPKVLFVHIRRSPILNAQSLLESRKNFFGSIDHWYSFKPPEYPDLMTLDPYKQVAGQVFFTNQAISDQLENLIPDRYLLVDYEEFCHSLEGFHELLLEKLRYQGWEPQSRGYSGPASFESSSELRLTDEEYRRIADAYVRFSREFPDFEQSRKEHFWKG
jgi:hypothetical protein